MVTTFVGRDAVKPIRPSRAETGNYDAAHVGQ